MTKPFYWGHALTAIGLITALGACSNGMPGAKSASGQDGKFDASKVGLATRAQAALAANDVATAVTLAEEAVEHRPQDASFRALLGNIYLASGRFASAEASYRDSLWLVSAQPQIILKLALVQIALGKQGQANDLLASAQSMLDPTDLGLALALAGRPDQAVQVLEPAARALGAEARTRQNLALAYALGGDWDSARVIAAQDVPANQLDARIDQWMALAKPGQTGVQIAALIGVTPAASDPGQPVRLALNGAAEPTRVAQAAPVAPVVVAAPVVETFVPYAEPAPVEIAAPVVIEAPVVADAPRPVIAPAAAPAPRKAAALRTPRPALTPAAVNLSQSLPEIRKASMRRQGRSKAVVQLGAYDSRTFISGAWSRLSAKHGSLKSYTPVTARFVSPKGTFYRLSVKGFTSDREAIQLCGSLKRAGGNCFVRAVSGDAPIQLASR